MTHAFYWQIIEILHKIAYSRIPDQVSSSIVAEFAQRAGLPKPTIQSIGNKRQDELDEIIAYGKRNSNSGYECVIGVSGGKDSIRQVMFAKEQMGLEPSPRMPVSTS